MIKKLMMFVVSIWFVGAMGMNDVFNFAPVHEEGTEEMRKYNFNGYDD